MELKEKYFDAGLRDLMADDYEIIGIIFGKYIIHILHFHLGHSGDVLKLKLLSVVIFNYGIYYPSKYILI